MLTNSTKEAVKMERNALERAFRTNPCPTLIIQTISVPYSVVVANEAFLGLTGLAISHVVGAAYRDLCDALAQLRDTRHYFDRVIAEKQQLQGVCAGMNVVAYPVADDRDKMSYVVLQFIGKAQATGVEAGNIPGSSRDLFDFSPLPMWVYDAETLRILAANKAALSDYGYSEDELLHSTMRILWPEDEVATIEQMIASKVRKNLPNQATVRHRKKSGEIITVNINSTPLPSWGSTARIVTATDVSQSLMSEQALKKGRDRLQSLLQTANAVVWEANPQTHRFKFVSTYAENLLGYTAEQWRADPCFWENHILPEDRAGAMEFRRTNMEPGTNYRQEYRMLNAAGDVVWVNDSFTPLMLDEQVVHRGLMTDITAAKRSTALDQLDKEFITKSMEESLLFQDLLNQYFLGIEQQFPGMICALFKVRNGKFSMWASPYLPTEIVDADEGLTPETASEYGFRSCLHHPIYNGENEVIAVFAVYQQRADELPSEELGIMERVVTLLRLILQKRQYSKASKEATLMMLQGQELASLGNWSWDLASDKIVWSDTLYSIYGLKPESFEPTYDGYLSLVHDDDRQQSLEALNLLRVSGGEVSYEERICRPDGKIKYLRSWAKVIRSEKGAIKKLIGACLDITESKRIQDDLLTSKAQLQKMLERHVYVNKATNDALYDWDIERDLIDWGESFNRLLGYSELAPVHSLSTWSTLVHPDDREELEKNLQTAINDRDRLRWSAGYRIRKKNGDYVFVEENGYLLRDETKTAKRMIGMLRDVTERKKTEEDLRLSHKRYTDLFHLSPLPLLVYERETLKILDVNKATIEHYGYSREEFLSFTLRDIRPPEDVKMFEKLIENEVKPKGIHSSFTRHVKKSGKIILVYTKGTSVQYMGRDARMVVSIDNSERIKAEDALIKSERRFKTMIQEGSDLIVVLDHEGNISYISPNVKRLFNLDPRDMILTNPFDYILEEDHAAIKSQLLQIAEDATVKVAPYRVRLKGGEIRWLETIITNKTKDTAIGGIIANSRDITARMKSTLKNKELLDRYNAVSKATSDTIWDTNLLTLQTSWSHSLFNNFGYESGQTPVSWWKEHVHPGDVDRVNKLIFSKMHNKETRWTSEYRFRSADGTYRTVLDRGFIVYSSEGNPLRMIGSMQDITERVAYVRAIELHNQRLREIAWMQSHLVRAPLAKVLGIAQILSDPEIDDESRAELLTYLSDSATELDAIIRDIVQKSQDL